MLSIAALLYVLMMIKGQADVQLQYYTMGMLVVIFLFIFFKLYMRKNLLRRPILRTKAIKTIIEFCQAFTVTIILVLGSLYVKDFYNSPIALNSTFEGILFWIIIVYQFWYSLVATIFVLLFACAALKCDFSKTQQVFRNLRVR